MINLAILEESPLIRLGLEHFLMSLSPDIREIEKAASVTQLLHDIPEKRLDLLVCDLASSLESSEQIVERLVEICHARPLTRLVIYTYSHCGELLYKLHRLSQISLISRQEKQKKTGECFLRVLAGFKVCSPIIQIDIDNHVRESHIIQQNLTPSEFEVLTYLYEGLSLSDIACQLNRSLKTLSTHKRNAMHKLGVETDAGLFLLKEHFFPQRANSCR